MTVARMTLSGLRARYRARWGREWPESNQYLAELWLEARADHNANTARVPPHAVYEQTLSDMRECHDFAPVLDAPVH